MAEDLDKSENATPYKLQEARKKGQVGKSVELPAFFSLLAMITTMVGTMGAAGYSLAKHTVWWFENTNHIASGNHNMFLYLGVYGTELAKIYAPIAAAGVLAVIIVNIIHVGPVLSFYPIKPDFSKMNPAKGLEKIFSRKSLVDLMKLVVKLAMFCAVAFAVWKSQRIYLMTSNHASMQHVMNTWQHVFIVLAYSLLAVFFISSIFDLWFSKGEFSRQMRMSKRDVKDEVKRREGDPRIKAQRKKALAELLAKAASTKNVKDSDVIITNPTHVAIALQYRPAEMALPIVLAKGQGMVAAEIRRQARKHQIPMVRKPELARALLKEVKIGDPVPAERQQNIASIYRWVLALPIKNRVFD